MSKKNAELLHLLFCDRRHGDDPILLIKKNLSTDCRWWLEESLVEMWQEDAHVFWLEISELIETTAKEKGHNISKIMDMLRDYCALEFQLADYLEVIRRQMQTDPYEIDSPTSQDSHQ